MENEKKSDKRLGTRLKKISSDITQQYVEK